MTTPDIPIEAIDAAFDERTYSGISRENVRDMLAAARPHLAAQALRDVANLVVGDVSRAWLRQHADDLEQQATS